MLFDARSFHGSARRRLVRTQIVIAEVRHSLAVESLGAHASRVGSGARVDVFLRSFLSIVIRRRTRRSGLHQVRVKVMIFQDGGVGVEVGGGAALDRQLIVNNHTGFNNFTTVRHVTTRSVAHIFSRACDVIFAVILTESFQRVDGV